MTIETISLAPDLRICRIINGMWQVAGGHGHITPQNAIPAMMQYHTAGLATWDLADIYGPAEGFFGKFRHDLEQSERDLSSVVGLKICAKSWADEQKPSPASNKKLYSPNECYQS